MYMWYHSLPSYSTSGNKNDVTLVQGLTIPYHTDTIWEHLSEQALQHVLYTLYEAHHVAIL